MNIKLTQICLTVLIGGLLASANAAKTKVEADAEAASEAEASSRMNVMVMTNPDPRMEGNIYAFPLDTIGATYNVYSTDQMDDAMAALDTHDIIMMGLLANANEFDPHMETLRKWVEAGGALCIFDACDGSVYSDFVASFATNGSETPSKVHPTGCIGWENTTKYGFVRDTEVPHPLRCFPRPVRYECRQWHCLATTPDWTTVATCSGPAKIHAVTTVKRFGRGFVYVAGMQQRWSSVAENLRAFLMCCRLGLEPVAYKAPQIRPGKEELVATFKPFDGVDQVTAELTVTDVNGKGKKQSKSFKVDPATPDKLVVTMPVTFKTRGAAGYKFVLKTSLGERTIIEEKVEVPDPVIVSGPLYRNRLSAFRRTDEMSVRVRAYPDDGRMKGDRVSVKLLSPLGAVLGKAKATFPDDLTQNEVIIKVPLPHTLKLDPSDSYKIKASVSAGGKDYTGESKFTVVGTDHAGEVTMDEDMTTIVDGKPFYPMVLYHIKLEYFTNAVEMGFNTVQTFQWFSRRHESFQQAEEHGLKIFFENNEKEPGGFVYMPNAFKGHKSMLFWYLPDEPLHEVNTVFVDEVAKILANDVFHPMVVVDFNSPRFEANARRCDILAPDCYPIRANEPPERQHYTRIVDSMDAAKQAVHGLKPVMHVLQSFGHETETDYMMCAFLSIARDARGLMWYAYDENDGKIGVRYHDDSRIALEETIKKVKQVIPYLLDPVRRPFETTVNESKLYGIVCGTENCLLIVVNPTGNAVEMPSVPEIGNAKVTQLFGQSDDPERANLIDPFSVRAVTWTGAKPKKAKTKAFADDDDSGKPKAKGKSKTKKAKTLKKTTKSK